MPLLRQALGHGQPVFVAVVLLVCVALFYSLSREDSEKRVERTLSTASSLSLDGKKTEVVNQYCGDRYGIDYLKSLRDSRAQYCSIDPKKLTSRSRMTCLSNNVDPSRVRTDSFCILGPSMYNRGTEKFDLNCQLETLPQHETMGRAQQFNRFPAYWYQTGPRYIIDHYLNLNVEHPLAKDSSAEDGATLVLIKRENANFNMWHSLMEIMSAYWSLVILSQTMDVETGRPLYSYSECTQLLVLDDIADGPYWDLWPLVAPNGTERRKDLGLSSMHNSVPVSKLIVPLPGGSNPFWQGDWTDLNCTSSRLLDDFSRKALAHFNYEITPVFRHGIPITLTYVDRVTKRRLVDQDIHLAALRKAYPYANIKIVDYASYTFEEQLKISATTDILVGVHGAGLIHVMFMAQGSALVEIMPYNLDHRGFKNMAKMRSMTYHQAKTEDSRERTHAKGDWQEDDVWLSEETFMFTVGKAIRELQSKRNAR